MSPAEKDAIQRRRERFVGLDTKEQQRIRVLYKRLNNDPRSAELLELAKCYSTWLKTLSSRQRAELLSLSDADKIVRIEELRQEQEKHRFGEIVSRELSANDLKAIFNWLNEYFTQHEDEWLAKLPQEVRSRIEQTPDVRRKRHALARAMTMHTMRFPRPDTSEVEALLAKLSDAARKSFREAQQLNGQGELIEGWIRVAVFTRVMGAPSKEDLKGFLVNRLDPQTRNQLEELPPDEMRSKLRRLYNAYKFRSWTGSHGGRPPHGRPSFRYGPGPPSGAEHRRPLFVPGRDSRSRGERHSSPPRPRLQEDRSENTNARPPTGGDKN